MGSVLEENETFGHMLSRVTNCDNNKIHPSLLHTKANNTYLMEENIQNFEHISEQYISPLLKDIYYSGFLLGCYLRISSDITYEILADGTEHKLNVHKFAYPENCVFDNPDQSITGCQFVATFLMPVVKSPLLEKSKFYLRINGQSYMVTTVTVTSAIGGCLRLKVGMPLKPSLPIDRLFDFNNRIYENPSFCRFTMSQTNKQIEIKGSGEQSKDYIKAYVSHISSREPKSFVRLKRENDLILAPRSLDFKGSTTQPWGDF